VDPYFLDSRWTFAFDLYAQEGLYTTFTRRSVGGSVTWGYELVGLAQWWRFARHLEDVRVFTTYTNEYVRVTQSGAQAVRADFYKSGTTSAIRLALQVDRRDNRVTPTAGHYLSLSWEAAAPFLAPESIFGQSVNHFTRSNLDARVYRPLFLGLVARARLNAGIITPWRSDEVIPVSERFFVGGINSVRGYRVFSLTPQQDVAASLDPSSSTVPLAVGGNKQLIVNLELEYPIVDKMGIRGVVFYDMGNTFPEGAWRDPAVSLSLYKAWGFGLRWFSPLGPLRFEWGFPLNRRTDRFGNSLDRSVDFQFTIGSFF
jgi:outer membrane protein insertion porin family